MNVPCMDTKSILRDVDVHVVRVEPLDYDLDASQTPVHEGMQLLANPPAYVFAVRPSKRPTTNERQRFSSTSLSASARIHPQDLTRSSLGAPTQTSRWHLPRTFTSPMYVHEAKRTYTECRALYQDLLRLTDCTHMDACTCTLGSCPFWTLYLLLRSFAFPRKRMRFWQRYSSQVLGERIRRLNLLLHVVFHRVNVIPHDLAMLESFQEQARLLNEGENRPVCKVLRRIEAFLDLRPEIVERLRAHDQSQPWKLNLRGWQSDRKNLYFQDQHNDQEEPEHEALVVQEDALAGRMTL